MKVYVGQTRTTKLVRKLLEAGIGECTQRGEYPPARTPWFLDNGAFLDWRAGREWDSVAWLRDVEAATGHATPPDFAVVPDVVAGGLSSLERSLEWLPVVPFTAYLAVQDGMEEGDVAPHLEAFGGLFVGGSTEWKLKTGGKWVRFAHDNELPCHIGRVGTGKRVRWAIDCGADSIDSCLPLFSKDNLRIFLNALKTEGQQQIWSQ